VVTVAVAVAAAAAAVAEVVSAKVTADQIDFSYDRRYVTLSGHARIFGQVVDDPSRYVRMHAGYIEGDLETGRFELFGDVEIITAEGALAGESVHYNMRTAEYSLRRGGVMLPFENPAGERIWGYAYAREISAEDSVVYITDGRFTTCPSLDPEYMLEVDRIEYHPDTMDISVWGGALQLYETRIPLLPRIDWNFTGDPGRISPVYALIPTYSSRDGVRLAWTWGMRRLEMPFDGSVSLKLTQRRGIRGELHASREWGNFVPLVNVTYEEDIRSDLDRTATIDRLPEVGLAAAWDGAGWSGGRVETEVLVGRYTQREDPDIAGDADLTESRLRVGARYLGNPAASDDRAGAWWWVGGSQSWYGDGEDYGWLEAGVGGGAEVTDWLSLWAEAAHYAVEGATPFDFDDIDIETELTGGAAVDFSAMWGTRLWGRYDLDRGDLRDYTIELRRRTECLTWTAGYHDLGGGVRIGLEVNGLFGNFEPPPQRSVEEGVPRYWDRIEGIDLLSGLAPEDEAATERTEPQPTSGARETP